VNYLAHFHLAQHSDAWMVGALLGEYVKGPLQSAWPVDWEQGIRLHRQIDAFSDQHPTRLRFAQLVPSEYRRYAGIVLDVYCDHLLSLHWRRFQDEPLRQFAMRVYALLAREMAHLSPPAARMAQRLIDHDVLCIYHDWNTVSGALTRIGERFVRANPLSRAGSELLCYLPQAEQIFLEFYPALIAQTKWLTLENSATNISR
jgi:acyl carrier protein phosphodiesterase